MKDHLISVIVPIYNVENYLRKCVDSIINQTYKNLEIILVDDGSPDNCGKICNEYAQHDSRVKVIHKENGGLSDARNAGIDMAEGEYLAFVDSDDYIAEDMIEKLYKQLMKDNSDMSLCSFKYFDESGDEILSRMDDSPIKNEIITGEQAVNKLLENNPWYFVVACNKLYKKELFRGIRFPKGKIHEDEFVVHHLFYRCAKISCISEPLYHYLQRRNSISNGTVSVKRLDLIEAMYDRALFALEKGLNNIVYASVALMAERLSNFIPNDEASLNRKKELYKLYLKTISLLKTDGLNFKRKIIICITKLYPQFLLLIKKHRRRNS